MSNEDIQTFDMGDPSDGEDTPPASQEEDHPLVVIGDVDASELAGMLGVKSPGKRRMLEACSEFLLAKRLKETEGKEKDEKEEIQFRRYYVGKMMYMSGIFSLQPSATIAPSLPQTTTVIRTTTFSAFSASTAIQNVANNVFYSPYLVKYSSNDVPLKIALTFIGKHRYLLQAEADETFKATSAQHLKLEKILRDRFTHLRNRFLTIMDQSIHGGAKEWADLSPTPTSFVRLDTLAAVILAPLKIKITSLRLVRFAFIRAMWIRYEDQMNKRIRTSNGRNHSIDSGFISGVDTFLASMASEKDEAERTKTSKKLKRWFEKDIEKSFKKNDDDQDMDDYPEDGDGELLTEDDFR